jgi:hypothetical protein
MRPDQIKRLEELTEKLADVFIVEADPENWSGGGALPNQMTQQERGDRHWDRKGAMGTGGVLKYALDLVNHAQTGAIGADGKEQERDADLDRKISDAEKRAAAAVKRVLNKASGKDEFNKRVHGSVKS